MNNTNTTRMHSPRIHIPLPNGDSSGEPSVSSESQQVAVLKRYLAKLDAVYTLLDDVRSTVSAVEQMLSGLVMEQTNQSPTADARQLDKGKAAEVQTNERRAGPDDASAMQPGVGTSSHADDKQSKRKSKRKPWPRKRKGGNPDQDRPDDRGESSGVDQKSKATDGLQTASAHDENRESKNEGTSTKAGEGEDTDSSQHANEGNRPAGNVDQRPLRRFIYNQKAKSISYALMKSNPRRDVLSRDADVIRRVTNILHAFIMGHGRKSPAWQKIVFVTRHRLISEKILDIAAENDLTAEEVLPERILERVEHNQKAEAQLLVGTPDQILNAYEKRYFMVENVKILCFEDAQAFCTHQGGDAFKVLERIGRRSISRRPSTMRIYGLDRDETLNFAMNADNGLVLHDRRTYAFELNKGPEARANFILELPEEHRKFRALVQLLMGKDNQMNLQDRRVAIFTASSKHAQDLASELQKECVLRDIPRSITILTPDTDQFGDIIIATDPVAFILRYHPVDAVINLCLPEPLFPGRSIDVVFRERSYCAKLGEWRNGYGLAVSICNNQEAATLNMTAKHSRFSLQPLKLHLQDSEALSATQQDVTTHDGPNADTAAPHSSFGSTDSNPTHQEPDEAKGPSGDGSSQQQPEDEYDGNEANLHAEHTSFASVDSVDIVQNLPAETGPDPKSLPDTELQLPGSSIAAIEATGPPKIFVDYQAKSPRASPIKRDVDPKDDLMLEPQSKKAKREDQSSHEADVQEKPDVPQKHDDESVSPTESNTSSEQIVKLPHSDNVTDAAKTITVSDSAELNLNAIDEGTSVILHVHGRTSPEETILVSSTPPSASPTKARSPIVESTSQVTGAKREDGEELFHIQTGVSNSSPARGEHITHLPTPDNSREEVSPLPPLPEASQKEFQALSPMSPRSTDDAGDASSDTSSHTAAERDDPDGQQLNAPVKDVKEEKGSVCTSH